VSLFAVITTFDDPDFGVGVAVFDSRAKAEQALADLEARDDHHVSGFGVSEIQEVGLNQYGVEPVDANGNSEGIEDIILGDTD
jgi:hypothetical protein